MRGTLIVLSLVLLPAPCRLLAQEPEKEPSLVELVRRKKGQEKESAGKKTVVISNADLRKFSRARVATSSASHLTAAGDTESEESSSQDDEGKPKIPSSASSPQSDEKIEFWKSALKEAQLNLVNAVDRGLGLQLQMNSLRNIFFVDPDSATRNGVQEQLDGVVHQIKRNREEIEEAKRILTAFRKEARKEGVPESLIEELTKEPPPSVEAGFPGFDGYPQE